MWTVITDIWKSSWFSWQMYFDSLNWINSIHGGIEKIHAKESSDPCEDYTDACFWWLSQHHICFVKLDENVPILTSDNVVLKSWSWIIKKLVFQNIRYEFSNAFNIFIHIDTIGESINTTIFLLQHVDRISYVNHAIRWCNIVIINHGLDLCSLDTLGSKWWYTLIQCCIKVTLSCME